MQAASSLEMGSVVAGIENSSMEDSRRRVCWPVGDGLAQTKTGVGCPYKCRRVHVMRGRELR